MQRSAGKSARAIQREYRVSWTTVQKALGSAWPGERKHYPDRGSKIDGYRDVIDDILRADLDAPRKQRHTAKRIFDRLLDEHGRPTSRIRGARYMAVAAEIRAEAGRRRWRCSSRRPTGPATRRRSTSVRSRSSCAASW